MMINKQALQRSSRVSFFLSALSLSVFLLSASIGLSQEYFCKVIGVDQNAWINRRNDSVKSSLLTGDYIYKGDKIYVSKGNSIHIALDKACLNIINIRGEASFEIKNLFPTVLDMQKGSILSLLDNKTSDRRYKIITHNSISTVRGTQFAVHIEGALTQVIVYHGLVQVSGKNLTTGKETIDYVILAAKQKTYLDSPGEGPQSVDLIDNKDLAEYNNWVRQMKEIRKAHTDLEFALGPIVPRKSILVGPVIPKEKFFDKKQQTAEYGSVLI